MHTKILLARHGETLWNKEQRLQGQLDSPLTATGIKQAEKLAQALCLHNISGIYSSPLNRAYQTALACAATCHQDVNVLDALKERHFGDWQGRLYQEVQAHKYFNEIFKQVTDTPPPNGESALQAQRRIFIALKTLALQHKKQTVLVVSHGDLIRSLCALFTQESFCDAYSQYGNGQFLTLLFDHQSQCFQSMT